MEITVSRPYGWLHWRTAMVRYATVLALVLLIDLTASVSAQPVAWDRVENIKAAAIRLARLQEAKGAFGAFAEINACYKRELAGATLLTQGLEVCLAQDIMLSKVSAQLYKSMSPEARKISGSPAPEEVMRAMAQRVVGVFSRLRVPEEETRQFNRQVEQHGFPALLKARFPDAKP